MVLLYLTIAAILFVPVLTGVLALLENIRAGDLPRQRTLCGERTFWAQCRAFFNSVWSLWLTVLMMPLGLLPRKARTTPAGCVPVILVHGLYHNPAAWLLLKDRLHAGGFADVRTYGYTSFGRSFEDIAGDLAQMMLETAADVPGGRVLLVGHSLGGLIIRAASADARIASEDRCRVAGIVTLGSPHRGSTLAGMLGVGKLARGLRPGGEVMRLVRVLPVCETPALSLYTATDHMVLPLSSAFIEERQGAAGWREECVGAVSHVGMLYDRRVADLVMEFLLDAASRS